jgi:uncharacterized membrane protein YdjX (TVP38/TMEM64 family)
MFARIKTSLVFVLPFVLVISLSYYLQVTLLKDPDKYLKFLSSFGPFVIILYIVLQALTIIIAPLGGFFLVVAMISLFGAEKALILAYLVTTPCYLINFYLARRFGRPVVKKVIGSRGLKIVDHLAEEAGIPTVVVFRVFQGMNFDYLAYGIGLTTISFKNFIIINILGGIPSAIISYFVLTRFENLTYGIVALYITAGFLSLVAIVSNHWIRKYKIKMPSW